MNPRNACFNDTSFWIAVLQRSDLHHDRATRWREYLVRSNADLVTTEPVLWEILNYFSSPVARPHAMHVYPTCHHEPHIHVIGYSDELISAATALYEQRGDKAWGITDCFSFHVMQQHHLIRALTSDSHFEQAGFNALLLAEP
jgi:predicted nucleic acid-binding protein